MSSRQVSARAESKETSGVSHKHERLESVVMFPTGLKSHSCLETEAAQ